MANSDLKEKRKLMLPSVTAFSPRDSLSKLSSPLSLPKEFSQMEQKLLETSSSEEDSLFCNHPSEDRIVLSHALRKDKDARRLAAIGVVAAGYGGDMPRRHGFMVE